MKDGGFRSFPQPTEGPKIRSARGPKFFDHFTQARMFFVSQAPHEQQHIIDALQFELSKVAVPAIRERMVGILNLVHEELASKVGVALGLSRPPAIKGPINLGHPAGVDPRDWQPPTVNKKVKPSPALSMTSLPGDTLKTRQVAILISDKCDGEAVAEVKRQLEAKGAAGRLVGHRLGAISSTTGNLEPEFTVGNTSSVTFDGVFIVGGKSVSKFQLDAAALDFVSDAFKHFKTLGATGEGQGLLDAAGVLKAKAHPEAGPGADPRTGVITGPTEASRRVATAFVKALAKGRHWDRGLKSPIPV